MGAIWGTVSIEASFANHTIAIIRLANVDFQNRVLAHQNQALGYYQRQGGYFYYVSCNLLIPSYINLEIDEIYVQEENRRRREEVFKNEIRKLEEDKRNKAEAYEMRRKILRWLSSEDFEETHQRQDLKILVTLILKCTLCFSTDTF